MALFGGSFWEPLMGIGDPIFDPQKYPKNSQKIFLKNFQNFPQNCHFELRKDRNFSKVGIHQSTLSKVQTNRR